MILEETQLIMMLQAISDNKLLEGRAFIALDVTSGERTYMHTYHKHTKGGGRTLACTHKHIHTTHICIVFL